MAIVSVGYDGSVTETQWAALARMLGSAYALADTGDWKVTMVSGVDRTVSVAPGVGYGHGVRDVSGSAVTLQLPVIASGTRWDLIAAHRDWQPPGGQTSFVSVAGGSSQLIPAARAANPGVLDDQPLALVQVTAGQTLPTAVTDLRAFPHKVITAATLLAVPSPVYGQVVQVGGRQFRRGLDDTGSLAWLELDLASDTGWVALAPAAGFVGSAVYRRRGNMVTVALRLQKGSAPIDSLASTLCASLPASAQPSLTVGQALAIGGGANGLVKVNTDGSITGLAGPVPASQSLYSTITYPV